MRSLALFGLSLRLSNHQTRTCLLSVCLLSHLVLSRHPYGLGVKKIQWLNSEKDQWVTLEEVADVMLSLIRTDNYKGGMSWK